MIYPTAFRFKDQEYYINLSNTTTFGNHKKDQVQVADSSEHMLTLSPMANGVQVSARSPLDMKNMQVSLNEYCSLSGKHSACIYVSRVSGKSSRVLNLPYNGVITCGRDEKNDIVLSFPVVSRRHFQILCESGSVHVEDVGSTHHIYLNSRRITKAKLKSGDILSIFTFRFIYQNGTLSFENMGSSLKISERFLKQEQPPKAEAVKKAPGKTQETQYLTYHLSPRRREQLPHEDIILSAAPAKARSLGAGRRGGWAYMISSGAMMAASLAVGTVSPALLLARAAGMISPIANLKASKKLSKEEQQQLEEYERVRQESYRAYIEEQKARIRKVADVQKRITSFENQAPASCLQTAQKMTRNLWERQYEDSDFLVTRLGIGRVPLCVTVKTRADVDGFRMEEDDELEEMSAKIIEETRYVDDMPVCVSLKKYQTIGLVGGQAELYYLLRSMIVEITSQHSAQDLRLAGLFHEDAMNTWGILRWLPHIWDESGQTRYIAFDKKRRNAVCEMLSQLISDRKVRAAENTSGKNLAVKPHILVIAQDRDLLYQEDLYENLTSNHPALGISTIILSDSMYNLPSRCQLIVEAENSGRCLVYEREKYDMRAYFTPDAHVHSAEMEQFVRKQAAIELETKDKAASIPASVTFLQGYQVKRVEELDVLSRWDKNKTYLSMAAPLGVMEGGKIFSLDVKSGDQSHGPHGLLAGTTGSGKSELLQSWILSMAVNYHPHDVNFVIIDYKGGGMSDLMEPLPHVVGKITNIDRNITRSLVSLKSELRRRQELFAKYGVNNIDKYQRAYDEGIAKERLPHLIIVTDEFAEMKKEEPEFMAELNSVATIGRSLGIHMLLATQKPAGVVTDQINANSRFRICMKVQDVADSREMLKRADAARITQAGRAYVRVGEDEYFTLFQSFYSAAEYDTGNPGGKGDNQVRVVGVTGERFGVKKKKHTKSTEVVDELTAVTNYINRVCKEKGIVKLAGPWLPELPHYLTLTSICEEKVFDGSRWCEEGTGLSIPIGKYDIPALQKQGVQTIDPMKDGHYGIFGIPGSGKTVLLKTILTSMGLHYSPKKVKVTILDAGNWGMSEFAAMPHVQEVILNQEEKKINLFISRMRKEMEARKRAFLKHAISSLSAYWETVSEDIPALVIMVDQIGPLFEQSYELGELFTEIAASGAAFGIYLIFTASSTIGIKYKFLQLIKGSIAFQMPEKGDYGSLVGPISGISLPQFAGRALAKGNPPVYFQTAIYADSEDEQKRHEILEKLILQMQKACGRNDKAFGKNSGVTGQSSRMFSQGGRTSHHEEQDCGLSFRESDIRQTVKKTEYKPDSDAMLHKGNMMQPYIGKDVQDLEPVCVNLQEHNLLLISSENKESRNRMLDDLLKEYETADRMQIFAIGHDNVTQMRENLESILNERLENYKLHVKERDFDKEAWQNGFAKICIIIKEFEKTAQAMDKSDKKSFRRIFTKSADLGVIMIVGAGKSLFSLQEPDILEDALIGKAQVLALDGKPYEYSPKQELDGNDAGLELERDEIAWICDGAVKVVRKD